jgi:cation diffusion facilitator family transporter
MITFLSEYFGKNSYHGVEPNKREAYGILAGIAGALCNALLFIFKLILGQTAHSVSITADAFNNLSDAGSSLIILTGLKLANQPANEKYPFGYGRVEYISGLVVALLMVLAGLGFMKSSIGKIIQPEHIVFNMPTLLMLIGSILLKLWLTGFNRWVVKRTNSLAINAAALDNWCDILVTMATMISYLVSKLWNLQIDGFAGVLVALFMVYSGMRITQNILQPLLGQKPDQEVVTTIERKLLSYRNIQGLHDLILHDYGPNKIYASVHVEVPSDQSLPEIFTEISRAEQDIRQSVNVDITIHVDPVPPDLQEAVSC